MSTPFRLILRRQLYLDMIAQARTELPNECCGLLAGRPAENGIATVEDRYPLVNAAASPVRYLSEPQSMFAAHKDMRRRGLEVLAIYHSHPTSAPIPSRSDREQSCSPDVINFIISLQDEEPIMQGWWLTADAYHPADWAIKASVEA